ncbi:hypothetical protein [Candidatus Thiodictyon syntrophicum]|jgi:hypothetical protein|uniref:Uncharacterized protein n=1 Tax=Candidatus Thiodictyon syntrophicum TaxID=1166950 RepID=A0A2K8U2C0_9GAMM|nr:hypothetical protein [Candidatus Thiodictyon syntrophicum]AUB79724.1 hypothetical protein THSYN_01290 [Candidatus Thiodictyon syntrophicum]
MKPTQFWKNFKLGEELAVSGTLIYNGMRRFHEMRKLDHTDEVFEVLYNLSVGFERLLKIAVILLEHNDSIDQDDLEKSLITHSHLDLLNRVKKHVPVNLDSPHNDLLNLLGTFYKSLRYERFMLSSVYDSSREVEALCAFLSKHLTIDLQRKVLFLGRQNDDRYRRFMRKTVLKISKAVFDVVKTRARASNLYTDELRSGSKAETVFLGEIDISHEDVLWKELLLFFMNTKSTSRYLDFLRGVPPLDFDPERASDYLDCFQSDAAKAFVMGELEEHYEELGEKGNRLELMGVIGAPNVFFDSMEDEEDIRDNDEN